MVPDRFELLLDLYESGEASKEELAELNRAMQLDPANRRRFVERFLLEVWLHKAFSSILPNNPERARWFRWPTFLVVAATLLLAVGTFVLVVLNQQQLLLSEVVAGQVSVGGTLSRRVPAGAAFEVVGDVPAVLRLPDDSRVELAPASKGAIRGPGDEARQVVELDRGSGTFQVAAGPGQFRVTTPTGTVTVLGTEFSVKLRPRKGKPVLLVAVATGTVQVEVEGRRHVLTAGKSRRFGENNDENEDENNQHEGENDERGQHPPRKNQRGRLK